MKCRTQWLHEQIAVGFKQGPSAQRSYASSIVDVQELLFSFKSLGHVNLAIQKMSSGSLQAHAPCTDEPPTNFTTNLISGRLKPHSLITFSCFINARCFSWPLESAHFWRTMVLWKRLWSLISSVTCSEHKNLNVGFAMCSWPWHLSTIRCYTLISRKRCNLLLVSLSPLGKYLTTLETRRSLDHN